MANHTLHSMAEVIEALGGQVKVGQLLGVKQQAVSNMIKRGAFAATSVDLMRAELSKLGHSAPGVLWRQRPVTSDGSNEQYNAA